MTMSAIMILHVVAGAAAVLSGAVALFAPKGRPVHRSAGTVFGLSMLCASALGAALAFPKPDQFITFLAGLLTFYLTATGWLATRRPAATLGLAEPVALLGILLAGAAFIAFGLEAIGNPGGLKNGYAADAYFFLGGVAVLAAALDVSVIVRRGLAGRQRIARHLWRMAFALFIAAGSLFTGPGAKAFPEMVRQSGILLAPEPIIILLMGFWLIRVLFTRRWAAARPSGE